MSQQDPAQIDYPEQKTLTETFIPKELIQKSSLTGKVTRSVLDKSIFQKVGGNIYLQLEPPQIKFAGYQLNKLHSATLRIINKAPIPQRVHILPPSQSGGAFSVKMNKKGAIPSGMSESVIVQFRSDVYKYQTDTIKINSETENFLVPIYAYPTIRRETIREVIPAVLDFGRVEVGQSAPNKYPIVNPVPMDFQFEFRYLQNSQEIMIVPLNGVITGNSTQVIEISFTPKLKKTCVAQVVFLLKQFDFQPLSIKILGNGVEGSLGTASKLGISKRTKSSKLEPIQPSGRTVKLTKQKFKINKEGFGSNARDSYKQEEQVQGNSQQPFLSQQQLDGQAELQSASKQVENPKKIQTKRSFVRSSFPKLLATQKSQQKSKVQELNTQTLTKILNAGKLEQRQYLSRFNRVKDLDKEKDIKFTQFLGDRIMTQQDVEFQVKLKDELKRARLSEIQRRSKTSYTQIKSSNVNVDYSQLPKQNLTFNNNKNDELKGRRMRLQTLMKAGTKVILKYRMLKRLDKIREFLKDCVNDKKKVARKVDESYVKSLEAGFANQEKSSLGFSFDWTSLLPQSFPIFHKQSENSSKTGQIIFKTEGNTEFDDLSTLPELQRHQTNAMKYVNIVYPADFVNLSKQIPPTRFSAQQQYPLRGSSLPAFTLPDATTSYTLPLKIPSHYFIYDNLKLRRYATLNPIDQKDPQYLYSQNVENELDLQLEDEFEGWSRGQYQILKAKFMRNGGVEFTCGFQGYAGSGYRNDCALLGKIDRHMPFEIDGRYAGEGEDQLDAGDSDQEREPTMNVQNAQLLMTAVEGNDKKVQERRASPHVLVNAQQQMINKVQINLHRIKEGMRSQWVDKAVSINKWVVDEKNRILL